MNNMFVLTQLVPRAHTTDTSIIAVSETKEKLEQYLSNIINTAREKHNDTEYVSYFEQTFSIHEVQKI